MKRRAFVMVCILMLAVGSVFAQEEKADWTPAPPPEMPEDWDWLQTTSQEWFKGEFLVMYEDSVSFDSDELDDLSFDWGDVQEFRTKGTMVVGLVGGRSVSGRLFLDGDTLRVMGEQDQTFPKADVLSITAGAPKEINYWDFYFSLGANYRTGNTEQTEMTSKAKVRRRTVKSRVVFDWLSTYNVTDDIDTADNQRLSGAWDLFISKRFFITPVFAEWFRDPFQNIGNRYTIAAGLGYDILDTPKIDWSVSGGPGYIRTEFDSVPEGDPTDDSAGAFILGTTYDHELTKRLDFLFDYRATFTNETSGKYLHHLLTSLEFELTSILDFDITWVWDRIQEPRQNADGTFPEQDDYRLSLMLGLDF